MSKPAMMLKWADEQNANPISREYAAYMIRANRGRKHMPMRIRVYRKHGETHISSEVLGVACHIFRAAL